MLASLTHTRSLHGGFLKLKQQNCNRIKSDGCTICLLDAKIAFGCFIFYILLSLSLSALCVLPERNHCQSCCWCSLRLSRGSRSDPSGFVPKWGVKHTHRKADVCEKGHLPPSLCTNTPEHQCLVRQRTNIPPSLNLHTLHRLRYHVFF